MTRTATDFSTQIRVRYSEIDGQKIVFNSRYLEYADVVLTEFWRWAALDDLGPEWSAAEFNVVRAELNYSAPFHHDDLIEGRTHVARLGNSSMTMRVELRHSITGELHTTVDITSVHLNLETRRPLTIPPRVRERLEALASPANADS
ncbi:acyl-CoA thioesterase [Stakelama tenebrarum]|uniref:Acyl-CoA thioesterase n=1 Tax=Stakelama tenebrarum TaxID=2711215 RepID=A0A6G6Y9T5_9SPHN|nr:thioesterase family protein [Sphingosinithalassobacter tenebrarum]QIG81679.1 acyl-CoA thioesterase [Sphingosinithalassobacter tenebrarum]